MASTLHIPFRCPNCGDNSRQFETLHDLRSHLEKEHSYTSSRYRHQPVTSSPAVGLRSRTGRHSPLTEMFHSDAQRLEESLRKRKEEELNNKRRRSEMSNLRLSKDSSGNAGFQEKIQNIPQHYSFRDYGHSSRLQKYYTPSKYLRDRQNIEGMQTNKAFTDEPYMRDKTKDEPISDMNSLFTDIQNKEGINRSSHFAETNLSSQMSPSITATPNPSEKHIKDTLSALSHEVLLERASQFATADSLYTAQELLSSVEQAAEIKIAQQKKVIEILAEKLKEKENRLAGVMGQIELLSHHQMDSFEKVSILKRQSDLKAQLLQKELDQKQKDFDTLNQKLFEIQQSLVKGDSSIQKSGKIENSSILNVNLSTDSPESSASMDLDPDLEKPTSPTEKMSLGRSASKTKEIKRVQNKAHQLERDRQNLLIEMQNLLQSAATDNEKLQSELASQSQELSQLSYDLEQSKHEQAALLGETHALYRQADVSLAQLKIMLKDREGELKNVSKSLEQAKAAQSKLARERDEYVRLCQERETKYKEMMSSNSQQIQSMKKTLDLSLQDKKQLEEKLKDLKRELDAKNGKDAILSDNVAHLKSALEEKMKSQAKLKEELHKREEKLKKAKREMERMTRFLEDTAEKELEARSKLEDFISGLIDRAGRAETELQKLKEESYRLHQKSKHSSKKHRRDSNQLDLSALPGASSLVAQTSLEDDTESLSSSNIPSTYQYDQKHYHSTPKAPTTQQLAPIPLPRKLSPRNFGVPHVTYKKESCRTPKERQQPKHIFSDAKFSQRLPMDENGIMWESSHDSRTHHNQDRLKSNDDTDIDEDISDFIYDAEPTHKSDSSQYFNVKKSPNKQSKYSPQFEEMPSVGKKMAKVLNADNAKTYKSSARDDYNKHVSSNYLPRSFNGYSSEESMEESPLQKARMVQKRLEYFTNSKPRDFLVSKQSEGFDVSHMDSDLSTSSYQSLYKPNNHVSSTVQKTVAENTIKHEELQSLPTKTEINHPEAVTVQQKYPDLYPDNVEKDYVNEAMEKETVASKPSLFAVQEISDNKSNLQALASHKQQSIQNQTPEVNQHSTVQYQPAAQHFNSIQYQVPDQHHLLEPHSPPQLVDQIKDHPLTSQGGDHMHSSEELGPPQHLPKSTLLEALEPTPMPVKEELPHPTEVLQGQNNPHPNSAVNVSNAENDYEDVSETSSDEDYTQADLGPTSISARKESIDASTDTDLEKLARPGYVQKVLVVRKNIPTVKHIRKNKRRKPLMKRMQSGDSSEADDLDDTQRERRHFIRRMRVALFKIFSFLDTATLVKMSCVCREWCKVSRHPALWKVVKLENKAISSSFLIMLSQWCTQTESLTLKGLTGRPINGTEFAEEYSNSIRGSLEAGLERFLSSCQNTITQVCIDQCDNILTDKCLWLVSGYCRLLTKLTYQSSVDCVTPQLMWALGGGCPGVTSLFIQPKPPFKANGMNNRCLLLIGQFYKDIQEIGLGGKEFDTAGLVALVKSCQRLQVVHLEYCMPVTSDLATSLCKVGLKNVQTLSILGTTVEAKALQTFQGNSRQLKKILVQMKLEDCVGDPNKKKDKETYKKMVKALEGLKTKAGIGNILTLEAGPAE
ncbi:uncharacterized protein LOC106061266 isoform X4 [Biomphalaria glabrata]|uniref:Uncharacterized protein LOC106061266 isoform X4 n=1 Tax=Biomphalaria glabrata TaxID=6526 RepID=A0A9W2ZKC6_BIOGL|nr:uncharacterized protein LOC106061266 isoform X4 [Biomphalaria glabrata]